MSFLKGQNLRLFMGESTATVVAAATSCQVHVAATLEDSSTKDDTTDWGSQECTGKSWDLSCDALVAVSEGSASLPLDLIGKTVKVEFAITSGDQNRTKGTVLYSGNAIVNDVSVTAGNKQNVTYTLQATGVGELKAG